ncbi:hypothetical protein M3Y97_01113700 [Aphelenchoides bicaudatus]|nr:hypothetical protein M3Y97_01113700 [Aphelenchoides bicaudatus]
MSTSDKTKIQLAEATSQYLEELEERRNECCCGLHVQTGSLVIGVIGVICSLLVIGVSGYFLWFVQLGLAALILILYVLVIAAVRFQKPQLFVPFLIVNFMLVMFYGFYYIVSVFFLVVDLISTISTDYHYGMHARRHDASTVRWITFAQMVGILVSLVVGMWFETIVYRAFRLMRDEITGIPSSTTFHTLKQAQYNQYKRTPGYVV